jgi:hypothetical protein
MMVTTQSNSAHSRAKAGSFLLASLLVCLFVCRPVLAQTSYCPESISVKQTIEKVPEGWTARQGDSPTILEGVTFFSGPPEEQASLVYDKWTRRNGLAYADWHFAKATTPIWLACRYASTSIFLARQLPAETSSCTVTYDPNVQVAGSPSIKKIACQ